MTCGYPMLLCASSYCMMTCSCLDASIPVIGQVPAIGPNAADIACSALDLLAAVCPILSHLCTKWNVKSDLTCIQEPKQPSDGANGAEANGANNNGANDELANFVEDTWNPRNPYRVRLDLPQTLVNR